MLSLLNNKGNTNKNHLFTNYGEIGLHYEIYSQHLLAWMLGEIYPAPFWCEGKGSVATGEETWGEL